MLDHHLTPNEAECRRALWLIGGAVDHHELALAGLACNDFRRPRILIGGIRRATKTKRLADRCTRCSE